MPLLSDNFNQLYLDVYRTGDQDALSLKRALAACDSMMNLTELLGADDPETIIDVGAGNGSLLDRLDGSGVGRRLVAIEISESALIKIKARNLRKVVDVKLFDGYHIPYPDRSFDLAVSVHVLEHVEHERMFLRELRRVAKRAIIEVPLENRLLVDRAIAAGRPNGHINFYTPQTFLNLVETSGMRVLKYRVTTSSRAYEQFVSGKVSGFAKNVIRGAALAAAPRLAPWLFTYLLAAYCEPDG